VSSTESDADPPPETTRREAAAWFARLRGPAAPVHQAAFDRWREGRADRQAAYDRLLRWWDEAAVLTMSRSDFGLGAGPRQRRADWARWPVSALVAGGALGALVYFAPARPDWLDLWPVPSAWSQRIATPVGDIRTVTLPDGSCVTLDTGTVVRWRFSPSTRRLALLRGRARFAVAHDLRRPFLVLAGGGEAAAHGTLFDVALTSGRSVSVTLLQGVVEVDGPAGPARAKPTVLTAGEELAFGRDLPAPRMRRLPASAATWPTGMLTFAGTPLAQALSEANRYFQRPIRLGTADLGRLQVSGAFHAGAPRAFADSLATTFDLQVRQAPDGALILDKPPSAQTP
jgi:transmembrane sensor